MNFNTEIGRIHLEYPVGSTKNIANLKEVIDEGWEVSDGYHTFTELYAHRIGLYIQLCKSIEAEDESARSYGGLKRPPRVWKSLLHSDGTAWQGWFILGINKEEGQQITYHLPLEYWDDTEFAENLPAAPKWDGHTPADVITRLKTLWLQYLFAPMTP